VYQSKKKYYVLENSSYKKRVVRTDLVAYWVADVWLIEAYHVTKMTKIGYSG
jgi:hypothetical protein